MWLRLPNTNDSFDHPEGVFACAARKLCQVLLAKGAAAILFAAAFCVVSVVATANKAAQAQSTEIDEQIQAQANDKENEINTFATAILHRSLIASVWGKPVHCTVRQTIEMFNMKMSGVGTYVRGGKGTGKMRYSLRFAADNRLNTLLQVCDGQRMLTINDIGPDKTQEEIDLGAIRAQILPRLTLSSQSINEDPLNSLYLAIGGQAEVLRSDCQRYSWYDVRETTLDGVPVWILKGKLADSAPRVRGLAKVDTELFSHSATGLALPDIELTIATDQAETAYWLHRKICHKPAGPAESGPSSTAIIAQTDWSTPQSLPEEKMDIHLFQPPATGSRSFTVATDRYLPPPSPAMTAKRNKSLR
ncbi:MAG: hypothetical protein Aurels2KO_20590 [Aureliella sp.]